MKDVAKILDHLGYDQVRRSGGDWTPLAEMNGRFDGITTDEVDILDVPHEEGLRLRDRETGEQLALARKTDTDS